MDKVKAPTTICECFFRLISASLTSRFGFLLSFYGRFFIEFLLSQITDNTVAGAFSLKTTQRAFYVFVFTYSYRGHPFHHPLPTAFTNYSTIIPIPYPFVKFFQAVF